MTDEGALLRTILAYPDDDPPRLVYADWLDETGEERKAEHARLIRLQCNDPDGEQVTFTFSNIYGHDLSRIGPPYLVLWGRGPKAKELANFAACSTSQAWRPIGEASLSSRVTYRRGFVESVRLPIAAFMGGECGRCQGRSQVVSEHSSREGLLVPCPCCSGSGRTEGIASASLAMLRVAVFANESS